MAVEKVVQDAKQSREGVVSSEDYKNNLSRYGSYCRLRNVSASTDFLQASLLVLEPVQPQPPRQQYPSLMTRFTMVQ